MLLPHDPKRLGIIIECKQVTEKKALEAAAQQALTQIKTQAYEATLRSHKIERILHLGIAFSVKKTFVAHTLFE